MKQLPPLQPAIALGKSQTVPHVPQLFLSVSKSMGGGHRQELLLGFSRFNAIEPGGACHVIIATEATAKRAIAQFQTLVTQVLAISVGKACVAKRVDDRNAYINGIPTTRCRTALPALGALIKASLRATAFNFLVIHRDAIAGVALGVKVTRALKGPCIFRITCLHNLFRYVWRTLVGRFEHIIDHRGLSGIQIPKEYTIRRDGRGVSQPTNLVPTGGNTQEQAYAQDRYGVTISDFFTGHLKTILTTVE
jgi:hypothetical protein